MTERVTNEQVEIPFEGLKRPLFRERRAPSDEHIRKIIDKVQKEDRSKGKRLMWVSTVTVLACLMLFIGVAVIYDMPGGIADQRLSQSAGMEGAGSLRIPIGRTPEEAVQKYRHFPFMRVIHKEALDDGALLFIRREIQKDGTDLQVEYVRKTWLGWKWVTGGGYAIGSSKQATPALNYMSIPGSEGIKAPLPIVFGEILNSSIRGVSLWTGGQHSGKYNAKIFTDPETGAAIWYIILPSSASAPYQIKALDTMGAAIASKTLNDPRDFGQVLLPVK